MAFIISTAETNKLNLPSMFTKENPLQYQSHVLCYEAVRACAPPRNHKKHDNNNEALQISHRQPPQRSITKPVRALQPSVAPLASLKSL